MSLTHVFLFTCLTFCLLCLSGRLFVHSLTPTITTTTTLLGFDAYSDNIQATRLSLFNVSSLFVTDDDDILILESGSSKIRLFNKKSSSISTLTGKFSQPHVSSWMWSSSMPIPSDNGDASRAVLLNPRSIIMGPNKELVVANTGRNSILKISLQDNLVETIAGVDGSVLNSTTEVEGIANATFLLSPYSIVLSHDKKAYYILENRNVIEKVNISTGIISFIYGSRYSSIMSSPTCMVMHPLKLSLYVCDEGFQRIQQIDLNDDHTVVGSKVIVGSGQSLTDGSFGLDTLIEQNMLKGIVVSSSSLVYYSSGHRVRVYNPVDLRVYTVVGDLNSGFKDNAVGKDCLLNSPGALALSKDEKYLYISDYGNNRIRMVNLQNNFTTTIVGVGGEYAFGEENRSPMETPLFYEKVILAASQTSIYYSDGRTSRIRRIENGTVTTTVGREYKTDCPRDSCDDIGGMALNSKGELYFTETTGCLIRKLIGSTVTTIAGTGICGNSALGIGALNTQVDSPTHLTFRPGNDFEFLFIEKNSMIKIYQNGTISSYAGGGSNSGEGVSLENSRISPKCIAAFGSDVYFCESTRIRKISSGIVTTIVGLNGLDNRSGSDANNAFISPTSIAFLPTGELVFTDLDNQVKYVYNNNVYFLKSEHTFNSLQQLIVVQNKIYLYDSLNTRIENITLSCPNGYILGANLTCNQCPENYINNEDYSQCILSSFGKLSSVSGIDQDLQMLVTQNLQALNCSSGYTGSECELPICYGKNSSDPTVCSSVGKCIAPNTCDCIPYGHTGSECEDFVLFHDILKLKLFANSSKLLASASTTNRAYQLVVFDSDVNVTLQYNIIWDSTEFTVYHDTDFNFDSSELAILGFTFKIILVSSFKFSGGTIIPKFYNRFRYYPISRDFDLDIHHEFSASFGITFVKIPACFNCTSSFYDTIKTYYVGKLGVSGVLPFPKEQLSPVITLKLQSLGTLEGTFYFSDNVPEPVYELLTRRGRETIYCLGYHCVLDYAGVYPDDTIIYSNFNGDYSIRNSNKTMVRLMNYDSNGSVSNSYINSIEFRATTQSGLVGRNFSYPINYIAYNNIPLSLSFYEKQQSISQSFNIKSLLTDPYILKVSSLTYDWKCSFRSYGFTTFTPIQCPKSSDSTQLSFSANYFKSTGTLQVILTLDTEQVKAIVNIVNGDIPQITTKSILPKIYPMNQDLQIDAYILSSSPILTFEWALDFGSFIGNTTEFLTASNSNLKQINEELYYSSLLINSSYIVPLERYDFILNVSNSMGAISYIKLSTTIDRPHIQTCYRNMPSNGTLFSPFCHVQDADLDIVNHLFVIASNTSTKRLVVSNTLKESFTTNIPHLISAYDSYMVYLLFSQHGSLHNTRPARSLSTRIPSFPSQNLESYIQANFSTIQQTFPTTQNILNVYSLMEYLSLVGSVDRTWLGTFIPQVNQYLVELKGKLGDQIEDKILPLYVSTVNTMFEVVSKHTSLEMSTELKYWLNWVFTTLKTAKEFYNSNLFSSLLLRSHVVELNFMLNLYSKSSNANLTTSLEFINNLNMYRTIFAKDFTDTRIEMAPLTFSVNGYEVISEILDTPHILNSKIINLPSSGISIQYPKSIGSIIGLEEPITVLSYASTASNVSLGPVLNIEISTQSGNSIPIANLTSPIIINFQISTTKPENKTFACQYFDTQSNSWSNISISTSFSKVSDSSSGLSTYSIYCNTTHLTQFGIFLIDYTPKSIVIPPIANSPTIAQNSNSTIIKQTGDATLAIVLGVVIPLVFILLVVIIVIIIVVILMVRRMKKPNKKPINHFGDNIVPVEENRLILNGDAPHTDIELIDSKPIDSSKSDDFPSTQISSAQINSPNTSQQTTSDFPSAYVSIYDYKESMMAGATPQESNDPISNRYKDLVKIGAGGFGSVFKCYDVQSKSQKAIKVMGFESFEVLNDMMKEATQLMNIKHNNIIKVNDMFVSPPQLLCIDMELYDKGDLMKFTKPGSECSEQILKQICYQMLDALNYVHSELNCCHRDVKPSNVFIRDHTDGYISIVLADFGLAKSNQSSLLSYSGTPLYMSPEIALGSANYGNNVDVYSLGVSLYQIITKDVTTSVNNLYFLKDEKVVISFLEEKMKESGKYSDEIISIIISMLNKDPEVRPQAIDLLNNPYFADQKTN